MKKIKQINNPEKEASRTKIVLKVNRAEDLLPNFVADYTTQKQCKHRQRDKHIG